MMNDLPQRKHPRLKHYDYGKNGCYFVTICTKKRARMFGHIVGRDALIPPMIRIPPQIKLTAVGEIVQKYINNISIVYDGINVDRYVIMPDHVHLLFSINRPFEQNGGMRASRPTLQTIVLSLKTMVTKELGYSMWQDSFFERVIRNEKGYLDIWKYIDENPAEWRGEGIYD